MSGSSNYLPAAARRQQILELIERRGFVRVSFLASHFGISDVTARADLEALAESNAVQRVHGGAVSGLGSTTLERSFEVAAKESAGEKHRIGEAAALLVKSHQVILLDVGTTTTALARGLVRRDDLTDVTVVTNSLNIAVELEDAHPRITVVVTGGTLRPSQHSLVDPMADSLLARVRGNIAFIGCNGISADSGVTNMNFAEGDMKRRMLHSAARRVVVADSTKVGVEHTSKVGELTDLDLLITGKEADARSLQAIRDAGLEVLRV
jgi:DeoR family transcriptional regulator of aga operon